MEKKIVLSNGTVEVMNFETVMKKFHGIMVRTIKRYKGCQFGEDDLQEGYIALWDAFTTYDEVHCFSTHATWKIRGAFAAIKTYELSPIRTTLDKEFINMEFDLGDGKQVGDLIEDTNAQFVDKVMESDFIEFIKANLNEAEMDLLAYNLGYLKIKDIAEKHSIGKSGVTNRNARFKIKLQKLISQYNA